MALGRLRGVLLPSNLTGVGRSTIPRAEIEAFGILAATPPGRSLAFGDYAIANPVYVPVNYTGSANIRYTITNEWLIYRGRTLKGPVYGGYNQFRVLAQQLSQDQAFCGAGFSWGDAEIVARGQGQNGPGNATTWRAVGTNHHITFVARELASWRVPSGGAAPQRVGP